MTEEDDKIVYDLVDGFLAHILREGHGYCKNVSPDHNSKEAVRAYNYALNEGLVQYSGQAMRGQRVTITEKGRDVMRNGGFKEYIEKKQLQQQRAGEADYLTLEKMRAEIEVLEKTLKDYSTTRLLARLGAGAGIITVVIELYKLFSEN